VQIVRYVRKPICLLKTDSFLNLCGKNKLNT